MATIKAQRLINPRASQRFLLSRLPHQQIGNSNNVKNVSKGFSLIELMITVAIVAVLAAIAIPSYQNYILKAHRKEAISQIYSLAERLERARSSLMSYSSFDDYKSSEFTRYQYSIDVADDGSSYVITAEALASQLNDKCGKLTYESDNSWQFGDGSLDESSCL